MTSHLLPQAAEGPPGHVLESSGRFLLLSFTFLKYLLMFSHFSLHLLELRLYPSRRIPADMSSQRGPLGPESWYLVSISVRSWISACTSAFGHLDDDAPPPPDAAVSCCSCGGGAARTTVLASLLCGCGGWSWGCGVIGIIHRRGLQRRRWWRGDGLAGDPLYEGDDGGVAGGGNGALLGERVLLACEARHLLPPPRLLADHPLLVAPLDRLQKPLLHRLLPLHHLPHQVAGRGIWTLHFGSHDALIPAQQQAILAKGTGLIPERINCDKMCVLPFGQTGSN
uniref:Uncharacterized protein n=1 Tax=Oryza meridionalis TaxID=40149 RepID=A0A0E0CU18_9ORYZ